MITKKAIHIWVLLILCIQVLYSQRGKDFFEVDNYIENNKSILCNISFDELPYKLTLPHWNDSEKARAIFYYLVTNYTYDYSQLENRDIAYSTEVELEAMNAFLTKKGTCYGLSCLFQYLAIEVGVESKIVEGSVKVKDASTQKLETHKDDHSWNAIFVDGHPYYIDISLSITNKSIFENFNNYWFLVLPEKFILSHFPKKEVDQGISPPIDYNAFLILPYIESNLLNVLELDEIIALSSAIKNDSICILLQEKKDWEYSLFKKEAAHWVKKKLTRDSNYLKYCHLEGSKLYHYRIDVFIPDESIFNQKTEGAIVFQGH
jgi:hypothetical protein